MVRCPITGRMIERPKCKMEFNKIELAWAGGLYTGEGGVSFARTKYSFMSLYVYQNDRETLEKFSKLIGMGRISQREKDHSTGFGGTSHINRIQIYNFEKIQFVMCLLWPYIMPFKRVQYIKALSQFMETKKKKVA